MGDDGWPAVNNDTCETQVENVFLLGDAQTGPSSIVSAISGGRKAASAIIERELQSETLAQVESSVTAAEVYRKKGEIKVALLEANKLEENDRNEFVKQEAERCLECSYVCSKCVDVCPNRANMSLPIPGFKDQYQTLHLDAYCNECGNCAQFCPWDSKPYKDKFTLFSLKEDFDSSTNPGFLVQGDELLLRAKGEVATYPINQNGQIELPETLADEATIIQYVLSNHKYLLGAVEV